MKKIFISALAAILLIAGGVWAFLANFEIVKKGEKSSRSQLVEEKSVTKICTDSDIGRLNKGVDELDVLSMVTLKDEILARKNHQDDVDCVGILAVASGYEDGDDLNQRLEDLRNRVKKGENPSLKIKYISDIYHYNKSEQKISRGQ